MNRHYVIVGSGVAAVHAAKAIRDQDAESDITIFGEENSLPYNRIKLTKGLFSDLHSEKVLIKKEKWYRDNRITIHTASRVASLHPESQQVETADGQRITYHKLLLCMGARNRALAVDGAGLKNVHTIRDLGDADRLKASLTSGQRVVVIGGGVQGLETAWALHEGGYPVTIIEAAPRLMARQLDEASSERLRHNLEQSGVQIKLQAGVSAITGGDAVSGVTLDDGTQVPCGHVVYSIGIIPNTELIQDTGIRVRSGVVVNPQLQTSAPHIYAAGDLAELDGLVEGLWGGAIEQGKVAGGNMAAAEPADYRRTTPVTLFNAFGISLFAIGNTDERQCDMSAAAEADGVYTRIFVKDNRLAGAISWEGAAASLIYKSAVEQGVTLEGIDVANSSLEEIMRVVESRLE